MEESILAHNTVPENVKALKAPKVDTYLNDIFKTSNRPLGLQVDEGLRRVQQKLLNTTGPLTKVWAQIDAIREGKSKTPEVDTFKLLELSEQSVTLLGQSNVALNYHRTVITYDKSAEKPKVGQTNSKGQQRVFLKGALSFVWLFLSQDVAEISKCQERVQTAYRPIGYV